MPPSVTELEILAAVTVTSHVYICSHTTHCSGGCATLISTFDKIPLVNKICASEVSFVNNLSTVELFHYPLTRFISGTETFEQN